MTAEIVYHRKEPFNQLILTLCGCKMQKKELGSQTIHLLFKTKLTAVAFIQQGIVLNGRITF
jgi:hypothetical protein